MEKSLDKNPFKGYLVTFTWLHCHIVKIHTFNSQIFYQIPIISTIITTKCMNESGVLMIYTINKMRCV